MYGECPGEGCDGGEAGTADWKAWLVKENRSGEVATARELGQRFLERPGRLKVKVLVSLRRRRSWDRVFGRLGWLKRNVLVSLRRRGSRDSGF